MEIDKKAGRGPFGRGDVQRCLADAHALRAKAFHRVLRRLALRLRGIERWRVRADAGRCGDPGV